METSGLKIWKQAVIFSNLVGSAGRSGLDHLSSKFSNSI
jgi:hypothetical protein